MTIIAELVKKRDEENGTMFPKERNKERNSNFSCQYSISRWSRSRSSSEYRKPVRPRYAILRLLNISSGYSFSSCNPLCLFFHEYRFIRTSILNQLFHPATSYDYCPFDPYSYPLLHSLPSRGNHTELGNWPFLLRDPLFQFASSFLICLLV